MTVWGVPLAATSTARYRQSEIEQILQCVEEGVYCAVLGPRLSGKTELLLYVEQVLGEVYGWTCVYIDLLEMRSSSMHDFFAELIKLVARRYGQLTGLAPEIPDVEQASSAVFRAFLLDCVTSMGQDLVLIIEHLEALPIDLVGALLTSLRAAYMDQQTQDLHVTVVVSGALSLASLTVGESSPFRGIARRVFINDLSEADSLSLICETLDKGGVELTDLARRRLLQAGSGDPYLIRWLCEHGLELAHLKASSRLQAVHIRRLVSEFLRLEVRHYAPLMEAVRLIEDDPDLLRCMIMLLEHEPVLKAELPLPLSPDLDPLFLTGVVEQVDDQGYRVQNEIYRRFLRRHFVPGRVGHMLAMTGRWDQAIDHLEIAVRMGDLSSRGDLLPAIINSIYAAQDLRQAAHFLMRGLVAAFGVLDVQIWVALQQENSLRLVQQTNIQVVGAARLDPEIPFSANTLEARALRHATVMRGPDEGGRVSRAIPLVVPGQPPVGVVTVWDDLRQSRLIEQRDREQNLLGFLHQAARALSAVNSRRQELILAGRLQASLLPEAPPQVLGWQFSAAWRPARETSGDFYDFIPLPEGKLGLVIADVVDKGMGAALYMALSRTLIRAYAADYPDRPDKVLQAVNNRMLVDADIGHFVTVFFAVLDLASGQMVYGNAGHNLPYIISFGHEKSSRPLLRTGPALGVLSDGRWSMGSAALSPDSILLLYTDGITDALDHHRQSFGEERLLAALTNLVKPSAQDVQDVLMSGVRAFAGDQPQYDDMTVLVALMTASPRPGGY